MHSFPQILHQSVIAISVQAPALLGPVDELRHRAASGHEAFLLFFALPVAAADHTALAFATKGHIEHGLLVHGVEALSLDERHNPGERVDFVVLLKKIFTLGIVCVTHTLLVFTVVDVGLPLDLDSIVPFPKWYLGPL